MSSEMEPAPFTPVTRKMRQMEMMQMEMVKPSDLERSLDPTFFKIKK